jgi:hypothetical protein
MKSEHRHELQTNELGKFTEKLGSFLEVHGNRLMIGICVVSLVASGIIYWVRTTRNTDAAAWRELSSAIAANKADDFKDVWNAHRGTPAGLWARLREGESRLSLGVQRLFDNLEAGTTDVQKARDAFKNVIDDRKSPTEARERALIGLGRALESLSEPTDAVKAYKSLLSEYPSSIYKTDAEERIAVLEKGSGQEFYAWFAKYPRPKLSERRPHDKFGDELNDDGPSLPEQIEKLKSDVKSSGLKRSGDDAEAPALPDEEESDGDKSNSISKPDGDSKADPDSGPDSKPDADGKSAPGSKPDES